MLVQRASYHTTAPGVRVNKQPLLEGTPSSATLATYGQPFLLATPAIHHPAATHPPPSKRPSQQQGPESLPRPPQVSDCAEQIRAPHNPLRSSSSLYSQRDQIRFRPTASFSSPLHPKRQLTIHLLNRAKAKLVLSGSEDSGGIHEGGCEEGGGMRRRLRIYLPG